MSEDPATAEPEMRVIADAFAGRRVCILQAWREAVDRDPALRVASPLARLQFIDHIPVVLDELERALRAPTRLAPGEPGAVETETGSEHGVARWQQGYSLSEVVREWGHLHLVLVEALNAFARETPDVSAPSLAWARSTLAALVNEGIAESVTQYSRLQEAEAAGHERDLALALESLKEIERERAEMLRTASHDLGGSLNLVLGATTLIGESSTTEATKAKMVDVLKRGVGSLRAMLTDLMDLARLQAGHERRRVEPFDAAKLLRDLWVTAQPLAEERGLTIEAEGPEVLRVDGDSVKVQRIAQNLILNALRYTQRGGVKVGWGSEDDDRWFLSVADTGLGFAAGPSAPLAGEIKDATEIVQDGESGGGTAHQSGRRAPSTAESDTPEAEGEGDARAPDVSPGGEGIGLSIVKRLSELLDASLALESTPGTGSTFKLVFPRRYEATVPTSPGAG